MSLGACPATNCWNRWGRQSARRAFGSAARSAMRRRCARDALGFRTLAIGPLKRPTSPSRQIRLGAHGVCDAGGFCTFSVPRASKLYRRSVRTQPFASLVGGIGRAGLSGDSGRCRGPVA